MRLSATVFMLVLLLALGQGAYAKGKDTMGENAQTYVTAFKRGDDFTRPAAGVFSNGQPDDGALRVLGQELAVADAEVREKIVELLVDMGLQSDPLTPRGAEVLRNPRIIELLANAGLAKADLGREAAMDALRKLVTQPDLSRHDEAFVKALEDMPTEEAFLLVAKAKPPKAKAEVDRLANLPEWKQVEAARIARAALGATDVENEFLAAAATAKDGETLAKALGTLALVGTPRSLVAVAERLRTPLTIHIPGAYEKSVRLNVLEALLYNYPDQPVLYPNNINAEADYTAAERFCADTLKVTYNTPPPPFMTYRGYPSPLP